MPSEAVENYLKAIHALVAAAGATVDPAQASIGDIAHAVKVTPGTATTMIKRLSREKLVKYRRYGGVELTPKGEIAALGVLRRHRLIETFLVRTLDMDWSEVHEEAEKLEHAVSDRLLAKLDAFLGHPAVDPHGDPIPDADGKVRPAALVAIACCRPGARVRLARVLDQRAEFLNFLNRNGLAIGSVLTLESVEPGAGTIAVRAGGESGRSGAGAGAIITIAESAAANLLVEATHRR